MTLMPGSSATAVPEESDELSLVAVFDALERVVRRSHETGRSLRSAAVKPALQAETGFRFREAALGFATFREFLRAAETAGRVTLVAPPTGPDVDVYPVGALPPAAREPTVRPDLWSAFLDWSPGFKRLFDRESGRAVRFREVPYSGEPQDDVEWRRAAAAAPERFIEIQPINIDMTLRWMREFLETLPVGTTRSLLEDALDAARPLAEFTSRVRASNVSKDWSNFRLRRVINHVTTWGERHGVHVDPLSTQGEGVTGGHRRERTSGSAGTPLGGIEPPSSAPDVPLSWDLAELREWAHRLVDRMNARELLDLPLTLDLLLRR